MITQRFTAICLLALYGVPVAIGPAWHRHDASCAHTAAPSTSAALRDSSDACCQHQHSENCESTGDESLVAVLIDGVSRHEACIVCRFYSQAQSPPGISLGMLSGVLVASSSELPLPLVEKQAIAHHARGPPAEC